MPILLPTDDLRLKEDAEYQKYLEDQEYQQYLESQGEEARRTLIPSADPRTQEGPIQPSLDELRYLSAKQAAADPETSPVMVGAGREFTKLGQGGGEIFDIFRSAIADSPRQRALVQKSKDERRATQEMEDPIYDVIRGEYPVKTFIGEMLPYVAAPLGPTRGARAKLAQHNKLKAEAELLGYAVPKMGVVEGAKTRALASPMVTGAVEGGVTGAVHPEMDAGTGVLFGAGGGKIAQHVGDMFSSAYKNPSHSGRELMAWADKNKLMTAPGIATGSPTMQGIDSAISTQTKTQEVYFNKLRKTGQKLNRMITDKLTSVNPDGTIQKHGVDGITDRWLEEHTGRIGKEMSELVGETKAVIGKSGENARRHLQNAKDFTTTGVLPIIDKKVAQLEELLALADQGAFMNGETYQEITRTIKKGITKLYKQGDADAAKHLKNIIDDIDDDIANSGMTDPSVMKRWQKARKDYALVSRIEEAKARNKHKGMPASLDYIDYEFLGKELKGWDGDPDFGMIQRYGNTLNHQLAASLSASAAYGKFLNPMQSNPRLGSLMHGAAGTLNQLPMAPQLLAAIHLTGWPYKRGWAGINSPIMKQGIESLLTRMGIGIGEKDDD